MNPEKHNGRTIQDIQSAPADNAGAVNALPSQEHVMTARRLKVGVVGASIRADSDGSGEGDIDCVTGSWVTLRD